MLNFVSNEDELTSALQNNLQTIEVKGEFANDLARRIKLMKSAFKNMLFTLPICGLLMVYYQIDLMAILISMLVTVIFVYGTFYFILRGSTFKKMTDEYIVQEKATHYLRLERKSI
ncbi:hypothetical protein I2F17_06605 [Acinetobacter sp. B10A]|uniref:hypothetical protein n=1 Tax=Acinetobacter baretiae TaxID=2605383 RepID=UPI001B3C7715|nr:hypothetical protein [Acinetobacter baretiae]MBF7685487.1 hypothetical protein [Acinetobacter baretiae]